MSTESPPITDSRLAAPYEAGAVFSSDAQSMGSLTIEDDVALQTGELPQLDLLIRTSGEERLSNFLLWEAAYAELYFTDTLWPDFDAKALDSAIGSYQERERRFGRTSEQVQAGRRVARISAG